jgi:hypothetical protein
MRKLIHVGRRSGRGLALGGAALALAAGAALGSPAAAAVRPAAPAAAGTCVGKTATGPFTISTANKTQVVGAKNSVFISYGTTIPGLVGTGWAGRQSLDMAKIEATADDWCGNTVRLQISQYNLLSTSGPSGHGFNEAYMMAIEDQVAAAEKLHLVVVINDSTESDPASVAGSEVGPTTATKTFWADMTGRYGHDPQVIFDLFNEPREANPGSLRQDWLNWRNGTGSYLGMQTLAKDVRADGATNLLWIEGPNYSDSFSGLQRYALLTDVGPVVYALHHPAGAHNRASWYADFGYLINLKIAPVVEGEWTNFEPAPTKSPTTPPSECWPDAPGSIMNYLNYLTSHGVGLSAYQLAEGLLLKEQPKNVPPNYSEPTTINPFTWSCQSAQQPEPYQGAGALFRNWLRWHNG